MLSRELIKKFFRSHKVINTVASYFYFSFKSMKRLIYQAISLIFIFMTIRNNKIVVCNYYGKGYGDNGKYICEEIIKQGLDYDIVWMLRRKLIENTDFPDEIRTVKYKSVKALYEMATAKVWIDNSRKDFYPIKRKGQYYIQTWHASMGLKRIEKDAKKSLSSSYIKLAKRDSEMCDLMISGSEFRYNLYRNSFWYDGEILKSGTPRCDLFFQSNDDLKIKVCKELNIPLHKKVVLYSPTFRKNADSDFYKLDYKKILKRLEEKFGEDWILLSRLHPNEVNLADAIKYSDNILNASHYADMQELLAIADVLITDYSSTMFDMSLQNKACFLYAPDLNTYLNNDRGLYFNYKKLPFTVATTLDDLSNNIRNFKLDRYKSKIDLFHKKIIVYEDGRASKKVVDRIIKICEK